MRHCAKITCFDVYGDVLASPFFIVKRYVISYNKNYIMKFDDVLMQSKIQK